MDDGDLFWQRRDVGQWCFLCRGCAAFRDLFGIALERDDWESLSFAEVDSVDSWKTPRNVDINNRLFIWGVYLTKNQEPTWSLFFRMARRIVADHQTQREWGTLLRAFVVLRLQLWYGLDFGAGKFLNCTIVLLRCSFFGFFQPQARKIPPTERVGVVVQPQYGKIIIFFDCKSVCFELTSILFYTNGFFWEQIKSERERESRTQTASKDDRTPPSWRKAKPKKQLKTGSDLRSALLPSQAKQVLLLREESKCYTFPTFNQRSIPEATQASAGLSNTSNI